MNFEFVSKSFSSLTQGHTIITFAIAAGGGDGASRLEAERHLLQTAVAVEKLHRSKFAKIKLRQDALQTTLQFEQY